MQQPTLDERWSQQYDQGRDYPILPILQLTKVLGYSNPSALKALLDIGCGTGQLTRDLYTRGFQCVGIDASASAIRLAKKAATHTGDELTYLHFDIEHDDITKLPGQPYGLIACKLVYAFIQDKLAFLDRVAKLLAPNGLFVVITPLPGDVPPEKQSIAATPEAMALLPFHFKEAAQYKEAGLTYFIGKTP